MEVVYTILSTLRLGAFVVAAALKGEEIKKITFREKGEAKLRAEFCETSNCFDVVYAFGYLQMPLNRHLQLNSFVLKHFFYSLNKGL